MVNVLVTGGAGFIGSHFVEHALDAHPDWRVTTLDKLTYAGRLENLAAVDGNPRHRFVRGDIADAAVAAPLVHDAEIVVHFAAETHVDPLRRGSRRIHSDRRPRDLRPPRRRPRRSEPPLFSCRSRPNEVYGSVAEGLSRETDEHAARATRTRRARQAPTGSPTVTGRRTGCRWW